MGNLPKIRFSNGLLFSREPYSCAIASYIRVAWWAHAYHVRGIVSVMPVVWSRAPLHAIRHHVGKSIYVRIVGVLKSEME